MKSNKRQFLKALASLPFWSAAPATIAESRQTKNMTKILIVSYSRTGNTAVVANHIQNRLGCDSIELKANPDYPDDYDQTVAQVRAENARDFSPPLKDNLPDLSSYDTIILGSPVWASRLALPVKTFLREHDLSGKKICPFVTYIVSSRGGECREQILSMQPNASVGTLLTVLGEDAANAEKDIAAWLLQSALV